MLHDRLMYPVGTDKVILTPLEWMEYYRRMAIFMARRNRTDEVVAAKSMNDVVRRRYQAQQTTRIRLRAEKQAVS